VEGEVEEEVEEVVEEEVEGVRVANKAHPASYRSIHWFNHGRLQLVPALMQRSALV
jgi:hypothetical protein